MLPQRLIRAILSIEKWLAKLCFRYQGLIAVIVIRKVSQCDD
jgi:hypothetical protein